MTHEPYDTQAASYALGALDGEERTEFATAIVWLASVYQAQGRYGDAESLYKRTLTIFEKVYGSDHPSVGASLNNLAGLYDDEGRYFEAEPVGFLRCDSHFGEAQLRLTDLFAMGTAVDSSRRRDLDHLRADAYLATHGREHRVGAV